MFLFEGQADRVVVDGKSHVSVYDAWEMQVALWGQPVVYRSNVQIDIPFLWDRDERDYVVELYSFIRERVDEH